MSEHRQKIWECKIGEVDAAKLPSGADAPMRRAVERAYYELTGEYPEFIFSGWGARLTSGERAAHEGRVSTPDEDVHEAAVHVEMARIHLQGATKVTDHDLGWPDGDAVAPQNSEGGAP